MKSKIFMGLFVLLFSATNVFADTKDSDKDILSTLIVLNQNEIAAAKEALNNTKNPLVEKFAHLMLKDHKKNIQETMKVSHMLKEKVVTPQRLTLLNKKEQMN